LVKPTSQVYHRRDNLHRALQSTEIDNASSFLVIGDVYTEPDSSGLLRGDGSTRCLDALLNEPSQVRLRAVILDETAPGEDFEAAMLNLVDYRSGMGIELALKSPGQSSSFISSRISDSASFQAKEALSAGDAVQAINCITGHDVEGYGRERLANFLWGHDVGSRDSLSDTERRAKLAFVCPMTCVGIPMILAGEEFCDQHDRNIYDKQIDPINWESLLDAGRYPLRRRLFDYVARLVAFRTGCPALGGNDNSIMHVARSGGTYIVAWSLGGLGTPPVIFVANFSD
jgi:hypothetical protein